MASMTSSRASHYDALGLSPAASQDEIAKAFGKAMGLFGARSAAAAAQIGAAFETLRNPDKRRAYDESLGLRREPAPRPAPMAVSFRISARPPTAEPHVERAPASAIASSLREIARPVDVDPPARPAAQPRSAPLAVELPAGVEEAEDGPIDWRRPAVAVGAVVLAAGLVGAFAGISVKGDEQAQPAVTTALPAAKAPARVAPPAAVETPAVVEPQRTMRARRVEPRPQRVAAPVADTAKAVPQQTDQPAADPLAPQPDPSIAAVAAADLPLAGKLVARTIDRIGYACGEVASSSAVDGAAGVYKVTCTSGQTYRAAPVHGRYRFRRWGSN